MAQIELGRCINYFFLLINMFMFSLEFWEHCLIQRKRGASLLGVLWIMLIQTCWAFIDQWIFIGIICFQNFVIFNFCLLYRSINMQLLSSLWGAFLLSTAKCVLLKNPWDVSVLVRSQLKSINTFIYVMVVAVQVCYHYSTVHWC